MRQQYEHCKQLVTLPNITVTIGGGAYTPIGHWRISLKTDTPNTSFDVSISSEE